MRLPTFAWLLQITFSAEGQIKQKGRSAHPDYRTEQREKVVVMAGIGVHGSGCNKS